MKTLNSYLLYYCIGAILLSCNTKQSPEPIAERAYPAYSDSYKAPVFISDETLELKPRQLPVSTILAERQAQIVQLIQDWTIELEDKILAENFYLDQSREDRINKINAILVEAGPIEKIEEVEPLNQLRGRFKMIAAHGVVNVFYTLTPEKYPKVQQLDISFESNE